VTTPGAEVIARASQRGRRLGRTEDWLAPALLVPFVVFQLGYIYGGPNYTLLYPWILRRLDSTLLAHDWFANTIPHHPNFVFFFAWIGRLAPLPAAIFAFYLLTLFLFLYVTNRFAAVLFDDRRIFYVALFLFLRWGTEGLGGNGLWGEYLLPHNAAVPLCLLAFYMASPAAAPPKPVAAALAAAAATWIHIQLGALTMLVLGLGMLFCLRREGLRQALAAGGAYIAVVAPTLIRQWRLYVSAPSPLSPKEFLALHAVLRQPHHLIPSSWPIADYCRFFLVIGIAALAVRRRDKADRTILTWCGIILALCVAGYVFVETIPVKLIIKMQLFRMTVFVKFFAVLYLARFLVKTLEEGRWPQKACALAILAIQNFAAIAVCAALIPALRQQRKWVWGLCLLAAGGAAGIAMVVATSPNIAGPWRGFAVAPRGVWVGVATLAVLAWIARQNIHWLPASLLVLAAALRIITGLPFYGFSGPPNDSWRQFCRQVRTATPRDAVFITPPFLSGFQMFAARAEVADFKCTPSIETDLVEWKRRMNDLAGTPDLRCSGWPQCAAALFNGYSRLDERGFLGLAQKYGAQYVVAISQQSQHAGSGRPLAFPVVLRVHDFVLYRMPQ
jgi:hypothetical protein